MKKFSTIIVIIFSLLIGSIIGSASEAKQIKQHLIIADVYDAFTCPHCNHINNVYDTLYECEYCGYKVTNPDIYGIVAIDFGHRQLDDGHYSDSEIHNYRYDVN